MTVKLPPDMPARIQRLKRDRRGYPVPWFVSSVDEDGEPEFRAVSPFRIVQAFKKQLCWVCGEPMGVHQVYPIGPMCVINRTTQEPATHRDCAEFSVQACPFLSTPRRRRNKEGLEDLTSSGVMIERNPGVVCLYETRKATPFSDGRGGMLFRLADPVRVDWWAEGRQATRAEVWASIESGYPALLDVARHEGAAAIDELERLRARAMDYLPQIHAEDMSLAGKWAQAFARPGEKVPVGETVVCDICSRDWSESPESGGFVFGSNAYCPDCAERGVASIYRRGEERFIRARCPEGVSFADFIRAWRGADAFIRVGKL